MSSPASIGFDLILNLACEELMKKMWEEYEDLPQAEACFII
jgi:hypothetical protein